MPVNSLIFRILDVLIVAAGAIDLFMAFDDDSNGYIDYDEFLRQIFPEEYVKDAGWMSSILASDSLMGGFWVQLSSTFRSRKKWLHTPFFGNLGRDHIAGPNP